MISNCKFLVFSLEFQKFFSITRTISLTAGQNNFCNKIPNLKRKHFKRGKESMTMELGRCHFISRFSMIFRKSTYLPKKCRFLGQKEKKLISLKKFCMGVGNRHPVLLHSRSCEGTESSHFVLRHLSFVQRATLRG